MAWWNRGTDFVRSLYRFCTDRSGNFGMLTAILMVPLIGSAGVAVDFAHALSLRTQLYAAADAAAVGAISEKSAAAAAAMKMTSDGPISTGQDDARNIFVGQMQGELTASQVAVNVQVSRASNKLNSAVTFTASIPTTFMQIFGRKSVDISGTATAMFQTASFMDFYILIDNTPSMGVGATPADVAKMESKTPDTCAFACHVVSEAGVEDKNSYYNIARNNDVTLRVDVVRQATQKLTETARTERASDNQFRMGVYTFGKKAEDVNLTTISEPITDLAKVASYTNAVTLMSIPRQGYNNDQQTSFDNSLTQMNKIISTPGDGSTEAQPQKILFFVSDGVGDSKKSNCTKPKTGERCQEPIDISFCKPLKDRGVKIAVLYTTYLPLPKNSWYNTWIKPFQSEIPTKMQSCASPGLYFEVTPTQGITDAMQALFLKVIRTPRITS
ncbi:MULTISPECIES: TadE/TadG family type IV pilus assembly protein [Rhizobium]|uniref:TadE/TadG family type IV pilus assembly protein n=1 Tax=Rhizobium TaxID=379 RepID=UPI0004264551|nr:MULTISPECIES: pilus assembly protein TadG-related protein [Rhizobium]MCS0458144.1 pilus assembly protein TadG-related protein [Rhizobium favelukesii]UFS80655.1 pilus assembly protein TadG-related protein [Rhizobium sp. T136]